MLIMSFVLTPYFSSINLAQAQTPTGYLGGTQTGYKGVSGYLNSLSPVINQLPLCKNMIGGAIKGLFKGANLKENVTTKNKSDATSDITKNQERNTEILETLPTRDKLAEEILIKIKKDSAEQLEKTKKIAENELCLKSIGKMVSKLLLQKLTLSMVAWINSGFEGKPFFIQDPSRFLTDITEKEILRFRSELDDENLYPYGRQFLQNYVNAFKRGFSKNAAYSLDEMIAETTPQYTANDFKQDFKKGGWGAWLAMTQNPANNPLGFQIMAENEIASRINNTISKQEQQLNQSGGFLSQRRCVNPEGLTAEQDKQALIANEKDGSGNIIGTCKKWEVVTPGKGVAEFFTKSISLQDKAYLEVDDLNTAIATIADALINQQFNNLSTKGFAYLDSHLGKQGEAIVDYDNLTGYRDNNSGYGNYNSQVEKDYPYYQTNNDWFRSHPDFNIRTDLDQALIDEQRIYIQKLEEQNKHIPILVKTIRQADYCLPGPHFGFEEDSRRVLTAVEDTILSKSISDFEDVDLEKILEMAKAAAYVGGAAIGAAIGSAVPGLGTAIGAAIGLIVGLIIDWLSGPNNQEKLDTYYGLIFRTFTKIHINAESTEQTLMSGKQDIINAMDVMLERYIELIHKHFNENTIPPIGKEINKEFNKVEGYEEIIKKNKDDIVEKNIAIKRLEVLKESLDDLNNQLNGKQITDEEYENQLINLKNELARISTSLIDGDDIAIADNLIKQIKGEIKYIYEDVLIGPFGCEKSLEQEPLSSEKNKALLQQTSRPLYPFYIFYDYNDFSPNAILPTPKELAPYSNKTNTNKMPNYPIGKNGPGFLSTVYYGTEPDNPYQASAIFSNFYSFKGTWTEKNPGNGDFIGEESFYSFNQPPQIKSISGTWKGEGGTSGNFSGNITYIKLDSNNVFGPRYKEKVTGTWTSSNGKNPANDSKKQKGSWVSQDLFNNEKDQCEPINLLPMQLDCLEVSDLFRNVNSWPVTAGVNKSDENWVDAGGSNEMHDSSFEQTIGIY